MVEDIGDQARLNEYCAYRQGMHNTAPPAHPDVGGHHGCVQVQAPVEAMLEVASHPDHAVASMSFTFWHRLSKTLNRYVCRAHSMCFEFVWFP